MKIYIASPFFNEKELRSVMLAERILEERGLEVFSPRLNEVRDDIAVGSREWSEQTFINDKNYIGWADAVVMLYHGNYSDSGTAWECGYAYATGTPVVVVHLGDSSNLMIHEGCHTNISMDELKTYDFDAMLRAPYNGKMF